MERKKIAFVVPYRFVPPRNGGHKAAHGFAAFLARKSELVVFSTRNNKRSDQFSLVPLFKDVVVKYLNPFVTWRLIRQVARRGMTDCITHQPFIATGMIMLKRWLPFRCGVYVQNLEYQRFRSMGKRWWPLLYLVERFVYRKADFLFFISPDDLAAGVKLFRLDPGKCHTANYGTALLEMPANRSSFREKVLRQHNLPANAVLFLFFGPQSYQPNLEAVRLITRKIYPLLQSPTRFPYHILICGGGLPADERGELDRHQAIHYLGYVEQIEDYILAADLVLNPILTGGGVKTKIIEAIALGTTVLSFQTGSLGMNVAACGNKLVLVEDDDINGFAEEMKRQVEHETSPTPESFYREYHWGAVAEQVLSFLDKPAPVLQNP